VPLTLSDAELAGLERCADALLAPLDYPDLDAWRATVNAAAGPLVGADSAIFDFAQPGGALAPFSDDMAPEYLAYRAALFSPAPQPADAGLRRVAARALDVFNTTEIVAGDWDVYDADPAMSMSRSQGVHDSVGMVTWARPGTPAAVLQLNRDRYGTEAFGDRGLLMFRLLRPAFSAGVRAMRRLGTHREALPRLLDAIGAALVAYDSGGRRLHVTPRLAELLGPDPDRAVVEQAAVRLACHLTPRLVRQGHRNHDGPPRPRVEVRTVLGTYSLSGFSTAAGLLGDGPAVVISFERSAPGEMCDAALRERFGLSPREVQIARLIATGLSNRAVAERLGLSPHTVRHHGERVFDKLGVRARADIAGRLRAE